MYTPKLSIIVPIYNAEKYLKRCLDSIASQTITDWECFLIDDGSKDRSGAICEAFSVQDERFKVIHKYNSGPSDTRNLGLFLAKGEWIGFVDADDWIEPNRFDVAIGYGEDTGASIIQCSVNVWTNGKPTRLWHLGEPGMYTVKDNKILTDPLYDIGHCWDKIYRASVIKKNNVWFPKCDLFEDTLFNTKLYFSCGKILSIDDVLYNYVINTGSLAHSKIDSERKLSLIKTASEAIEDMSDTKYFDGQLIRKFFDNAINVKCKDAIDYVFPYVDNTKAQWINEYNQYTQGKKINNETNGLSRFRSGENLLRYKFRAIEKWMPWINTIHMIVSDITQVPDWIDQSKVHIVLHKDIIPEEFLPTFNSCTIEMFIHNIFGLSEKFIYSNDDMYPNYRLVPKFYFTEDNKLKSDLHIRKLWHDGDINQVWAKIPINSTRLASLDTPEYANKYIDGVHLYELQHIGKPMFRSICFEVMQRYKDKIYDSISRFREDKNLNQYLFTEYALFHGRGSFETFRHKYFQIGKETPKIVEAILEENEEKRTRSICCNDGDATTEYDFLLIENAFKKIYPNKCKYEV